MSDRIAWPLYLALCILGMAMVFVGIAARDAVPSTLSAVIAAGGGVMAVLGAVLWWRALIRRHGRGRMLIWLVVILGVLFVIGLVFQKLVEDRERELLPDTAVI